MTALGGWENFYVIVGSSAGALIGLQFVVITLIAGKPIAHDEGQGGAAFATPTVVHFGVVLFLSAAVNAPWHDVDSAAVLWCLVGACGAAYEVFVARRMRKQTAYRPEFEDWLFHFALPLLAYAVLAGSALAVRSNVGVALCCLAAAMISLLFIGIHNAWDAVTYHVFANQQGKHK
jgi:hypothetical protein